METAPVEIAISPIGAVRGGRGVVEDDDWGNSRCRLVLDGRRFEPDALAGLAEFSHVEVVFVFNRVAEDKSSPAHGIRAAARTGRRSASSRNVARTGRTGSASASAG